MSNYVLILKKISHDENEEFAVYPKKLCILFFQYVLHTYITHLVALCNHSKSITCSQILYSDCDLFGTMGSRCAFDFIKSSATLLRSSSNLHGGILNIQKKSQDLLTLSPSLIDEVLLFYIFLTGHVSPILKFCCCQLTQRTHLLSEFCLFMDFLEAWVLE